MKKWHAIVGAILIFGAGFLAGAAGAGVLIRHRVRQVIHGGPDEMRHALMWRLDRELDLEPEQEGDVEAVLLEMQAGLERLRSRLHPEVEQIISRAIADMRPILTEKQFGRLQELRESARDNWTPVRL